MQVCKYSEWSRPIIVDMTELALCAEIDPLNFTAKVCANSTVLQNLMANPDNSWLTQHCANHSHTAGTGEGGGGDQGDFKPEERCLYSSWLGSLPSAALLTLCWEHDQTGLVSAVCQNAALLFLLSREPSAGWLSSMCTTYTNYTSASNNVTNNNSTEPHFCLARSLVRQLNWTCSADLSSACRPDASHNVAVQIMVRCWLESLVTRVDALLTPPVAAVLEQAVSSTVVILLALEEVQNRSLHVAENIRQSVLKAVVGYLKRENSFEKKRVLLQCFGVKDYDLMCVGLQQAFPGVSIQVLLCRESVHVLLLHAGSLDQLDADNEIRQQHRVRHHSGDAVVPPEAHMVYCFSNELKWSELQPWLRRSVSLLSFLFKVFLYCYYNHVLCHVQEYFRVPLSFLRPLLSAASVSTVRLILRYYSNNKQTLQVRRRTRVCSECVMLCVRSAVAANFTWFQSPSCQTSTCPPLCQCCSTLTCSKTATSSPTWPQFWQKQLHLTSTLYLHCRTSRVCM